MQNRWMLLLVFCLVGCSLKDIRPKSILNTDARSSELGRTWIKKMQAAHGGYKNWINLGTVRATIRDEWPQFLPRTIAMPWDFSGQKLQLTTQLSTDNMYLKFLEGDSKDKIWGLQNWETYTVQNGKLKWSDDDTIRFWLPTLNYFIQLPFRISEGNVQLFSDFKMIAGKRYARVFVSWGKSSPQDDIDQYVLWIDATTGLLTYVEYTVRDIASSIVGRVALTNFKKNRGMTVPGYITTIDEIGPPGKDFPHRIVVDRVDFGAVPERPFVVDPTKSRSKL